MPALTQKLVLRQTSKKHVFGLENSKNMKKQSQQEIEAGFRLSMPKNTKSTFCLTILMDLNFFLKFFGYNFELSSPLLPSFRHQKVVIMASRLTWPCVFILIILTPAKTKEVEFNQGVKIVSLFHLFQRCRSGF